MIRLTSFAKVLFLANLTFSAGSALAYTGTETGNGGDMCEDQFKIIRDDINSWIQRGGAKGLKFPAGISVSDYSAKMAASMQSAVVSCTSDKIYVASVEKTCKNTNALGKNKIICNAERFNQTSEADRYVLVHHEYAGLSGFEVNADADSNYTLSNQISEYLEQSQNLKLAIKEIPPSNNTKGQHCIPSEQVWAQANILFPRAVAAQLSPALTAKGIHIAQVIAGTLKGNNSDSEELNSPTFITQDGTKLSIDAREFYLTATPFKTDAEGNILECGLRGAVGPINKIFNVESQLTVVDLNSGFMLVNSKDLPKYPPSN